MIHIDPISNKLIEKKICKGACSRYLELNQFYQFEYGKHFSKCMKCQSEENRQRYHKNKILKSEMAKVGRPRTNVDLVGIVGRS